MLDSAVKFIEEKIGDFKPEIGIILGSVNMVSISILEKAVLSTINVHFWTVRRLRWRMVCG